MPTVSISADAFATVNQAGTAAMGTTATVYGWGYGATPGQIGISFTPSAALSLTLAYGVAQTVTLGSVTQNEAINGGVSAPALVAGGKGIAQTYGPSATDEPTVFGGTDGHTYYHLASNQPVYTGPSNSPATNQGGFYAPAEGTHGGGVVQPDNTIHADNNYLDVGLSFAATDGAASASLSYLAVLGRLTAAAQADANSRATGTVVLYHGYVADPDIDYRLALGTQTAAFANGDMLTVAFSTVTLANNPDTAALTATVTLSGPPPAYAIAATDAVKAEGNTGTTPFTFTVTRTGDTSAAAALTYAVTGTGASPAPASEFTGGVLPSGTASFAAGASSATITVPVAGNTVVQPDLGFTVTLTGPTGTAITTASASGTIQNDDLPASYAIAAASADKPDGTRGTTPYTFTVTRSGDTSQAATLGYAAAGTGSSPAPAYLFANPAGTVAFAAGAASATITLNVNAAAVRVAETFAVTLSGPAGTTVTQATATGVIRPNNTAAAGPHDLLLTGTHDQYVIAATSDGRAYVQDTVAGRDGTQTIAGLQHINFADGNAEFDPTGTVENVTRLYQAAFNRAPDLTGLDNNVALVQSGTVPLGALAQSFTGSPEFLSLYGAQDNAGFVAQMYQNVLHRTADAAGAQVWLNYLGSGATRGQVLTGFADSTENRAQVRPIAGDKNDAEAARMYQAALNRTPDTSGLAYWSGQLQTGANPEDVARGFTDSNEFKQLYGTLNSTDFVTQLYANVLNRAPDAAGQKGWVDQLDAGATRQHVLIGFSDSTENHIKTAAVTHDAWVFLG